MSKKPAPKAAPKKKSGIKDYFKGVRVELKKVVWPNRKEAISYTGVVIMTCFVFAMLFWGFDSLFLSLLKAILNISI